MKEITRIHLAKIAYDIEIDAKKDIQKYIAVLERYADDAELMGDIEIRITELLAERGVSAGGVITASDVAAVRERLGEPSDFAGDEAEAMAETTVSDEEPKRVYRDEDEAVLGGVLAGIAKYLSIDPLWVRLAFLVLLIASFGTALIVYIVLWAIIPPAKTTADKLRMSGHPVTLASIKALGERAEPAVNSTAQVAKSILRVGLGALLLCGAAGAIVAVVAVGGIPYLEDTGWHFTDTWWHMTGFLLCALAGLLLAALLMTLASAVFRSRWSRGISTAVIVISIAGVLSFFGGLGTFWYGAWQDSVQITALMQTTRTDLPNGFMNVKTLKVSSDNTIHNFIRVEYNVADKAYWELKALPGVKPSFELSSDGAEAIVKVTQIEGTRLRTWGGWEYSAQPVLKIYGPALDVFEARDIPKTAYYNEQPQDKLSVVIKGASFELSGTNYKEVSVTAGEASSVNLNHAAVESVIANTKSEGAYVEAGVIRSLTITQPDICPRSSPGSNVVYVQAVSSGKFTYNGTDRPVQATANDCGEVHFGDSDSDHWEHFR